MKIKLYQAIEKDKILKADLKNGYTSQTETKIVIVRHFSEKNKISKGYRAACLKNKK